MSNSKGALPDQQVEFEILNKKAIIIGLVSLFIVLGYCYVNFYVTPLVEESYEQLKKVREELNCNDPFELFKKYPTMNTAGRDYVLDLIEQECGVKP